MFINIMELTFQMELFWQAELQNNNIFCIHPSIPQPLFLCFEQIHGLEKKR